MSWRASTVAAVVVLAAVASVAETGSGHPRLVISAARADQRLVASASLSCPGSGPAPGAMTSVFAVGPDATSTVGGAADLQVAGLQGSPPLGASAGPGRPVRVDVPETLARSGLVVTANGAQAPGASAVQLSTFHSTRTNGSAASWCERPSAEWWFSGVDTSVGTSTLLVLSNLSQATAVVDLQLMGADGLIDAAGATGIPVAPRSREVLDLARYAPGEAALTLRVRASRGTVSAAVTTTRLAGVTPVGAEWVPASAAPATTVVVDAGIGGVARQSLVVTNAGGRQQLVAIKVLDSSGAFRSTLLPDLQVPPYSVVVTDVSAILKGSATAFELTSAGPVTGAQVSEQESGPLDFAVAGVGDRLTTPAVVPLVDGAPTTLSFATSSPGPQRIRVDGVTASGSTAGHATVTVNGQATTAFRPPDWGAVYLVVTVPAGSDVHGVAGYVSNAGITELPLSSAPRTVLRPPVLPF